VDGSQFDRLIRDLRSRRTALGGLLGALLLPLGTRETETAAAKSHRAKRRRRRRRHSQDVVPITPTQTANPGIRLQVTNATDRALSIHYWSGTIGWLPHGGRTLVPGQGDGFDTDELHAGVEIWNYPSHPFIWAEQPASFVPPPKTPNATIQVDGAMGVTGYIGSTVGRRDMAEGEGLQVPVPLGDGTSITPTILRQGDSANRRTFTITFADR
jgi:hypothetical protein